MSSYQFLCADSKHSKSLTLIVGFNLRFKITKKNSNSIFQNVQQALKAAFTFEKKCYRFWALAAILLKLFQPFRFSKGMVLTPGGPDSLIFHFDDQNV